MTEAASTTIGLMIKEFLIAFFKDSSPVITRHHSRVSPSGNKLGKVQEVTNALAANQNSGPRINIAIKMIKSKMKLRVIKLLA
jgi:hypothetical protein